MEFVYTAERGAWLRVPRSLLDMERVKTELYFPNAIFDAKLRTGVKITPSDYEGIELWEEDGEFVLLPRSYDPPLKDPNRSLHLHDVCPSFEPVQFPPLRRRLRENQYEAWEALCTNEGDKLLCLGCGKGKTTLALMYAGRLQRKTLIIVDQEHIADQWEREIKACYWIPRESVGRVQAKKHTIGTHFTIAVLKTLAVREFDAEFYDQFGLVIPDEGHVLGAPQSSVVLPRFPGERLVLTATPNRRDNLEAVFMLHAGGHTPVYTNISRDRSSTWYFADMPALIEEHELRSCMRPFGTLRNRKGERVYAINRPIYDTKASESPLFNRIILQNIMRAVASGRSSIVLGTRVEQLELLVAELQKRGVSAGVVTGKVRKKERKWAFQQQVICATWQLAGKALDIARLDSLFLLFPNSDENFLRQAVGRIDRELEGKRDPLVVTLSHEPLDKKKGDMVAAIRALDPGATIKSVRVAA